MTFVTSLLVTLTVLALVVLGAIGLRSPLMLRLGLRNALRHRRQTATVVAGLLVGTMVIGASLVTGDSLEAGLRSSALGALDEVDVVVSVPGELLVPEELFTAIGAAPTPSVVDGAATTLIHRAAVEHAAADLYEPTASFIGFDPEEDRVFGPFTDAASGAAAWGDDLGPEDAYVNERLAQKLEVAPGDVIRITYVRPFLPVVPDLHWLNGTLYAASGAPSTDGLWTYTHSDLDEYELVVDVPRRAEGIVAGVFWASPSNSTDLDLELVAPDGSVRQENNGTAGPSDRDRDRLFPEPVEDPVPDSVPLPVEDPTGATGGGVGSDGPVVLQVPRAEIQPGEWTMRVHSKSASNQGFFSFLAVLQPEYDLERARASLESLRASAGATAVPGLVEDDVMNLTSGLSTNLTVRRVVAMEGKGAFFYGDAFFVRKDLAQELLDAEGRANWLKVSAVGDREEGLEHATTIADHYEERIETLAAERGAGPSSPEENLQARAIKAQFIERTEEAASVFTQFLTLIGSFALVAGVMLIVNIFSMLAEERRHELGISRAVGLTRRRLVATFTFEGGVYTVLAAAAGVLAALALSFLLVTGINSLVPEGEFFQVPFHPTTEAVLTAFSVGVLLTLVTVVVASVRASRLDIAQAIRGEADHPRRLTPERRRRRLQVYGGLIALLLLWMLTGSFWALSIAPPLVFLALGPLLALRIAGGRAWILAGLGAIVVTLTSFGLLNAPSDGSGDASSALRGLLLVIAATIVLVNLDRPPRALARWVGRLPRMAPLARVAFTYPLERRFRTGLTVSMYALVLLIITMFSTFFVIFLPDITTQSGGFDVIGDAEVPVQDLASVPGVAALAGTPDDPFLGVERHHALLEHFEFGDDRIFIEGQNESEFSSSSARFYGFDADFAAQPGFRLDAWDSGRWSTEEEVWLAVADDPRLVIVSHALVADLDDPRGRFADPGDVVQVNTTGGRTDYVIAGIMEQHFFGGVWMAKPELEERFANLDAIHLFELEPGVDPDAAAKRIERAFRSIGMDADSVAEEAREFDQQSTRIFQLLSAYLSLGLVVGVASIGIMTSRAVLERRRELGMLKAIGFTRRAIAGTMLLEVLLILFTSAVIGVGLGLAIAYLVYTNQVSSLPGTRFGVPWVDLLQMLGIALVATLLATVWPLVRASRLSPSEALRTIE